MLDKLKRIIILQYRNSIESRRTQEEKHMKRLNITYDTAEIENGEKIVGEPKDP